MNELIIGTARTIIDLARHRDISLLAGGIAFFAFLSLIPAMVLVLAIGSFVGGEQFAQRVVSLVESYLSAEGSQILTEALAGTRGLASVSAVSALFLVWSTLRVFRAIDVAFNRVYRRDLSPSLLKQLQSGAVVLVLIGVGVGLLLTVQMALTRTVSLTTATLLSWPVTIAGLVIVLLPLYYVLPPVRQPVQMVLPGTLFAIVGVILLRQLFQVYTALAGQYQAYGFIGAVLLFLLWLYFGALVLIFGAIINAALADTLTERSPEEEVFQDESTPKTSD